MNSSYAYVGCRTTRARNARGKGISVFRIDDSGHWHPLSVEETRPNPSYLAIDASGGHLYAIHGDGTEMSSFRIEDDGRLSAVDSSTIAGLNPVDAVIDPTHRHLIVTNHLSGSLVVHRLAEGGRFGSLTSYVQVTGPLGPHKVEQTVPKPHQAVFDASGKRVFVPNKGTDTVSVFDFDTASGMLTERHSLSVKLREGAGPRNAVLHPILPVLFVVGELDSAIYVLRIEQNGELIGVQVLSCLPESYIGSSRASAVVISDDCTNLHVSNRGHDSVCTFDILEDGRLAHPRWVPSGGRTPRFVCLDLSGTGLLVANEDSDCIVKIPYGSRKPATLIAQTASPTCIVFKKRNQPVSRSVNSPADSPNKELR